MPRWLIVVAPAILLFGGLILTGPLAWLGGILLFVVWLFLAWLTALSWPALDARLARVPRRHRGRRPARHRRR